MQARVDLEPIAHRIARAKSAVIFLSAHLPAQM